jgi:hypothetical protein
VNAEKAGALERLEKAFKHVGLLANGPPGKTGLPFISHPTTDLSIVGYVTPR